MYRLFLSTSHFDLEGWQMYPPTWILWGAYSPLELQISLKTRISPILNGFERSIHLWIGIDIYHFSKIAAILNFHVNMPPSWILGVLCTFKKKSFSTSHASLHSFCYKFWCLILIGREHILNLTWLVYRLYNFDGLQNMRFGVSSLYVLTPAIHQKHVLQPIQVRE